MTPSKAIRKARSSIAAGRRTFAAGGEVSPKHFSHIEYFVVYQEAIELLLQEGFIDRQVPKLHDAFYELIPKPKAYADEAATFRGLAGRNVEKRIQASSRFDKLARAEGSVYRRFLFQYPRTFDQLLDAVADEEPKVVENVVRALGCASSRYFDDPRVFEALLPLLSASRGNVLLAAVHQTRRVHDRRKYAPLLERLAGKPNQPLLQALAPHFEHDCPVEELSQAQRLLVEALGRKLNAVTRNVVLATLVKSLDQHNLNHFARLVEATPHPAALLRELERSARSCCSGERQNWLARALFA